MNERTRRIRRTKTAMLATAALAAGWIALEACSNMGEGERCQTANNNDDCENGLICLAAAQVNQAYNNADRCCPPDRSVATHPACKVSTSPIAGDSAPPPDTGPPPADSGGDTGADTGADTGTDAGDLDASDAADG